MAKGLLMVNTGDGKGKTTAALGQAMRALGHGKRICIIQFIKGSWTYGELLSVKRFRDLLDFHVMGRGFTFQSDNMEKDKSIALEGWNLALSAMHSDKYFMVILDELTYLMTFGLLETQTVIDAFRARNTGLHVMVTGRYAPRELIQAADLVTEMTEVKHPYTSGCQGQKGIEF